jgi:phosphoribosylanthranilate isomerase
MLQPSSEGFSAPTRTVTPATREGLVHVAGIKDLAEAKMLVECGVSFLGFPLVLDVHREDLTVNEAAAIVAAMGSHATFFLITYLTRSAEIRDLCHRLGVGMVQLHAATDVADLRRLREERPGLRIVKSLIIRSDNWDELVGELERFAPWVDAFITDTYDPETGASGATGKNHDWSVSRRLVDLSPRPIVLAGGLNPGNVRGAIGAVRPAGVDVHTGIEGPDGRKRRDLTEQFVAEARAGFARGRG